MENILLLVCVLAVTSLLALVGSQVGMFLFRLANSTGSRIIRRKLSVYGYQRFYSNVDQLETDEQSRQLLPVLREIYERGSSFNTYLPRLLEERLPMFVVANWARSVAEDVFTAPVPTVKVDQWAHYWKSKLYLRLSFYHPDFPTYSDEEMGCLWGALYLWLAMVFDKELSDPLMRRIMQLACREKISVPYFYHFYNAVREIRGEDYFLYTSTPQDANRQAKEKSVPSDVSAEEIFKGFEALSVAERRQARIVLNDLLAESEAWKEICNEMKRRGWFKEDVFRPMHVDMIAIGDHTVLNHNH